nr:hypothetical protein pmam_90 [Pithovirus mammoth]
MQELINICKKIVEEYRRFEYSYSESEKETFEGLRKFSKSIKTLGDENHEFILESLKKFWLSYGELFEDPSNSFWYKKSTALKIYNDKGKVIKGPIIHLSEIYIMAGKAEKMKPKSIIDDGKEEPLQKALEKRLFAVLAKIDEDFAAKLKPSSAMVRASGSSSSSSTPTMPFDLSKLTDIVSGVIDSGILPGSETADKEGYKETIRNFMDNPKLHDLIGTLTNSLSNSGGNDMLTQIGNTLSGPAVADIIKDITPKK